MDLTNLIHQIEVFFQNYGLITIFLGSLIEITPLGWTIPGGAIIAVAGFFSNTNDGFPLILVILSGTLGAWITFLLAYFLGKKTGLWLVKKLKQERNANMAKNLLKTHGAVILTTSMMANLTRFWVAYIAGVESYNFYRFLLYSSVASLSWVSLMATVGYLAGFERENLEQVVGRLGLIGWLFFLLSAFIIYKSVAHERKHFKEDLPHDEKS